MRFPRTGFGLKGIGRSVFGFMAEGLGKTWFARRHRHAHSETSLRKLQPLESFWKAPPTSLEASGSISFDLETSGAHGSISFSQLSCSKTGKPSGPQQHVLLLSTAGELLLSSMYPTSFMYFRGRSSESLGSRVVYGRRDSDIGFGVYWHQHSVRKLLYLRKLSNDGAPKARSRLTLAAPR